MEIALLIIASLFTLIILFSKNFKVKTIIHQAKCSKLRLLRIILILFCIITLFLYYQNKVNYLNIITVCLFLLDIILLANVKIGLGKVKVFTLNKECRFIEITQVKIIDSKKIIKVEFSGMNFFETLIFSIKKKDEIINYLKKYIKEDKIHIE